MKHVLASACVVLSVSGLIEILNAASLEECATCPAMANIPAGSFEMGGYIDYGYGERDGPAREVHFEKPFLLSKREVTRGDFRRFVEYTGYVSEGICNAYSDETSWGVDPTRNWSDPGFPQEESHPVVCVSWDDAKAYIAWLNAHTERSFRLPTESEWEYAAYLGGIGGDDDTVSHEQANIGKDECCGGEVGGRDIWMFTSPVGSFAPGAYGLSDMRGNVWEWQADCYHEDYVDAPTNGGARKTCDEEGARVVRGGSYGDSGDYLSRKFRLGGTKTEGYFTVGFRVAHDL